MEDSDPVTNDMFIGQTGKLEQLQWFVRAHIENTSGRLPSSEDLDQLEAAAVAAASDPRASPRFGALSFGGKNHQAMNWRTR